jgi:uncharacterized protein (DUF2384 family)
MVLRQSAGVLGDVTPLLSRVLEALGTNAAARLLGAGRAQVSRWRSEESISSEMGRRIVDLHDILTRILRVYGRELAAMWLVGSEPLPGGARPIDVLALEGAAPVIRAIDISEKRTRNRTWWSSIYLGRVEEESTIRLCFPPSV